MAKFTQEQQAAIDGKGRVIVSASAGSGKTTVMIEKIIRLIVSGVRVDKILAVTFTKKAAAQMKEKLSAALIKYINAPETTEEKRKELKIRLSEVPNADVSTIHSFCAKLLRANFFAAGVDNAFRVIDGADAEGRALKNAALDELFEEGYAEKDGDFSRLLSAYWRKKSDNALRRILTETYETLRSRADYKEYLRRSCGYTQETFDGVCADLHAHWMEKCRYYQGYIQQDLAYFQDRLEKEETAAQVKLASELSAWLQELLSAPDYFACVSLYPPKFTRNTTKKNKYSEETFARVARLGGLKERMVKAYEKEFSKCGTYETELENFLRSGETAKALAVCLLGFDEKYAALKAERGVLDYNDLEHKTLQLLQEEEIVAQLKEKYAYVFVDEYQDVNPVQEAIVSLVSGENLFLVGDVKQSIYGFRGSKSKFFVQKQAEFEEGKGLNLKLTRNFRSADAVLNAVNAQFSLAMTKGTASVDYAADSYMERGGRYALNSGRVCLHFFGEKAEKETETRGVYSVMENANGAETEESRLARLIKNIIDEERSKTYFDADEGTEKQISYADIALLSRKKKGEISKTVAALSAMGLPVTSVSAINVCDYAEVKTLIDILSLLDNGEQDIPLCSALLSPMGDCTADDLAAIRLAYKTEKTFRAACKKYAAEKTDFLAYKLQKFYAYYQKTRVRARVLDAGELLTLLLSETRMEAALLTQENGPACLKRIHRFIEETALPEPMFLHAFLEKLRDMEYKIEYCESGGEDSVKVLTMHSSKGLEYPVVILDNLSAPFRGVDHDEVFAEEKYGLAPRAFNEEKLIKSSTLLRRLYEWEEEANSTADELNLYYVALTRAKYALHLLFEKRSAFPDVRYAKSFADFTDFTVWEKYAVSDELIELQKQEREALVFRPDETLVREIMREFTWEYPYRAYERLPVKSSATQLLAGAETEMEILPLTAFGKEETPADGLETEGVPETEKGAETGIEAGLAYHAFLEYFDFSALFDERGNRKSEYEIGANVRFVLEEFRKVKQKESEFLSAEKLTEILCNPIFTELFGMKLYKEQQFLVSLPVKETYAKKQGVSENLQNATDGEEMIFQGAIDLLAVGEGEARVIDYKYSTFGAERLKNHYKPQLELYRKTAAKILKLDEKKVRCTIVNIFRGFQTDVD